MDVYTLQKWFSDHVSLDGKRFLISDEQAAAILDDHTNTIVTARAGSGKTWVIVAKIVYLIAHEGIDADEIIAFAFNQNARNELNDRLARIKVDEMPIVSDDLGRWGQIATTFHSFAARARTFGGAILSDRDCDDKIKQAYLPNRSYYIQRIIREKLNKKKVLDFMRDGGSGDRSMEDTGSDNDRIMFAREDKYYETLNGEIVKSFGEKIIADYLFEHDIEYYYEKYDLYPSQLFPFAKDSNAAEKLKTRSVVRPDFYLSDYNLIWEHWGISGKETPEEIQAINKAKIFDGGYATYLAGKKWKEWFYSRDWLKDEIDRNMQVANHYLSMMLKYEDLITTYKEPFATREEFEAVIEARLSDFGIHKPRLSEEEIVNKLLNNKNREVVTRLTEQITSFIDKAEHGFMANYEKLHELCRNEQDPHVSLFYELALEVLDYYNSELTADASDEKDRPLLNDCFIERYTTDFNILLDNASKLIETRDENPRLRVDGYKYIFIDEYQDFSELFYKLIVSLRGRSENAKMMVVGDDWQAINSYAGSDLKYFENFEEYFPEDHCRLELLTNFRSAEAIVEFSNSFMNRAGISGAGSKVSSNAARIGDALQICQVTEIRKRKDPNPKNQRSHSAQKYDLALMEIIRENKNKSICILSRKKNLKAYGPINNCKKTITGLFEKDDNMYGTDEAEELMKKIDVSTVNSAKGCEADIVVIIETDNGSFPVIHPDTKLYKVFGESDDKMIDEQKRLFYVALTRPKEKLYILHEKDFDDEIKTDNFLTMLDKNELEEYTPKPRTLQERIINDGVKSFIANGVETVANGRRPENQDYIVTAINGEQVRQFNVNRFRDRESCEVIDALRNSLRNGDNGDMRIWVDVQEGRWIHFRKRRPSDLNVEV